MNYLDATKLLVGRCKDSRKLENNTYLKRRPDHFSIRLHDTDIIDLYSDYTVLRTGGWRTPTTKDRLNQYTSILVRQVGGIWYIGGYLFQDNMEIEYNGTLRNPTTPTGYITIDGEQIKLKTLIKQIKEYANKAVQACPMTPSPGDCFVCQANTAGINETTKRHLLEHFKEGYIVPSLIYKACQDFPISKIAKQYLTHYNDDFFTHACQRQIRSSIIRYLKRQFGIAL